MSMVIVSRPCRCCSDAVWPLKVYRDDAGRRAGARGGKSRESDGVREYINAFL